MCHLAFLHLRAMGLHLPLLSVARMLGAVFVGACSLGSGIFGCLLPLAQLDWEPGTYRACFSAMRVPKPQTLNPKP